MSAEPTSLFLSSVIDFAALVIILLDAYFGFRRGLSGETSRFFCLILGVVLTALFLHPVGSMCFRYASPVVPEPARHAFAFLAAALASAVVLILVYRPIYNWMDRNSPKHQNKFGGLVAGLLRGFVGVMFVMIILNLWPTPGVAKAIGTSSVAGKTANKFVPTIKERLSSQGRASDKSERSSIFNVLRNEKRERSNFPK